MSKATPNLEGKAAELAEILRANLGELKHQYGVESLGILGSYLRGEEQESSDLDLLVEFDRGTDLFEFVGSSYTFRSFLGFKWT